MLITHFAEIPDFPGGHLRFLAPIGSRHHFEVNQATGRTFRGRRSARQFGFESRSLSQSDARFLPV